MISVITRHYTSMAKKRDRRSRVNRAGVPLQVYFRPDQMSELREASRERGVPQSAIVRSAVDQFLSKWKMGQLDLPLGLRR
jgi:hypothetical protein